MYATFWPKICSRRTDILYKDVAICRFIGEALAYCDYLCFPRCCGNFTVPQSAPGDCNFYFESRFSSTYTKNGSRSEFGAFAGIDVVSVSESYA